MTLLSARGEVNPLLALGRAFSGGKTETGPEPIENLLARHEERLNRERATATA